ncbi:MAG TPA: hypothetical protein VIW95_14180 [Candidatus Binatus sp.]|uniref:Ig-like domain-containing protein n=1 Tax=Candidatus Binatus sp. TaxID=2811406 RepID=UPI002F3ECC8F
MAWSANNNPLLVGGPNDLPSRPEGPADFATSPPGAHLTYYGGRVVSNMKVVQVLWGTGGAGTGDGEFLAGVVNTSTPSMATFYQQVLNSAYVDWLTEYNTDILDFGGNPGTNQTIGRGTFVEQVAITPANTSTSLTDADIKTELVKQIKAGHLPLPTADGAGNNNTYYAIFFPHGIRISQGGTTSCMPGGFCAYHGTIVAGAPVGEIYYGVHPDMQAGSGCQNGCGDDPTPFNNYTSVASHEMAETITDCEVSIAPLNGPPLGWYDDVNGEIGDICNAQQGSIVGADNQTYTVQKLFSNVANDCIVTPSVMGAGPNLNITPTMKDFGTVKVLKLQKQTFVLTNEDSSQTITFSKPLAIVTNSPIFKFPKKGATTCHQTLPPKGQCNLTLEFIPKHRGTPESGTVTVFDDAGNADQTIPLSGTGK